MAWKTIKELSDHFSPTFLALLSFSFFLPVLFLKRKQITVPVSQNSSFAPAATAEGAQISCLLGFLL